MKSLIAVDLCFLSFPIILEYSEKTILETVHWFQNESDPFLNSNAFEVAGELVQKHFPGFGTNVLESKVVDIILKRTTTKTSNLSNEGKFSTLQVKYNLYSLIEPGLIVQVEKNVSIYSWSGSNHDFNNTFHSSFQEHINGRDCFYKATGKHCMGFLSNSQAVQRKTAFNVYVFFLFYYLQDDRHLPTRRVHLRWVQNKARTPSVPSQRPSWPWVKAE